MSAGGGGERRSITQESVAGGHRQDAEIARELWSNYTGRVQKGFTAKTLWLGGDRRRLTQDPAAGVHRQDAEIASAAWPNYTGRVQKGFTAKTQR